MLILDNDSSFFLNGHGLQLGRIQNSKGSLLEKVGLTCGIPDLNATMLRQAAECVLQSNEKMQVRSKLINCHSERVGRSNYERRKPIIRTEFINFCDRRDNPRNPTKEMTRAELEKRKEMLEVNKRDAEERQRRAEEVLQRDREERNKSKSLGKRCKVLPNDRFTLQQLVLREVFGDICLDFPQGLHIKA